MRVHVVCDRRRALPLATAALFSAPAIALAETAAAEAEASLEEVVVTAQGAFGIHNEPRTYGLDLTVKF